MRVRARGFGWRWNGRRAWAVRGLDLDVEAGERVLLLGASGAGKSTLLTAVAGLLDGSDQGTGEQEGSLEVDGVPAQEARARALAATTGRARTGLLLQDPQAQTVLARCGDDVAFGLENHSVPRERIWPRVDAALTAVGLAGGRARPTARLSGGERQRLALAGVLALEPDLLLLDEPTAMLDPDGAAALRDLVAQRLTATGSGCLLVEHRVALWLGLVDRVVVLAPGAGVLADGPPVEVLGAHGPALAGAGVWVPGLAPRPPAAALPGPPGELLLELEDVAVARRGGRPVLTGVDAVVRAGEALAVRGANGAGKSTLALALAGLAPAASGHLTAAPVLAEGAGPDPFRWRPRQLVARVGSVFQDPRHQFVAGTVADELAVGPHRLGVPAGEVAARVEALLERLRLGHLARASPFTLSGGEQRRLSVGTALAARPRLLVLDEPTFGQDAVTWAELVDLLRGALVEGTAVVAATHDDDLAGALGATTWRVGGGRLVAGARAEELSAHLSASGEVQP